MNRTEIVSSITGDKVIRLSATSGLEITVSEMPGFSSVTAYFATRYGSVNNCFRLPGETEFTTVPAGIAHYLEHKLFENEDCDAFGKYAAVGAAGNAFTGFDVTAYTFSCTRNWQEALGILIDLVQNPYFTPENVAKEQGIIAQEIKMTGDNPERHSFFTLLDAMFQSCLVKTDQAGTVESIAQITPELLYRCYDAFYDPGNMVLVIAGNVTADQVEQVCKAHLRPGRGSAPESFFPPEPETVCKEFVRETLPVGKTFFNLGYKLRPCSPVERFRRSITGNVLCELLTSPSSPFCKKLIDLGVANSTLSGETFSGNGYFTILFSGESDQPEKAAEYIAAELERMKNEGIDTDLFRRLKKISYGSMVRTLNNVDTMASLLLSTSISGAMPYAGMDILSALTEEDILEVIREMTEPKHCSLVIAEGGMNNDNS